MASLGLADVVRTAHIAARDGATPSEIVRAALKGIDSWEAEVEATAEQRRLFGTADILE